jgi:hypothetical protein
MLVSLQLSHISYGVQHKNTQRIDAVNIALCSASWLHGMLSASTRTWSPEAAFCRNLPITDTITLATFKFSVLRKPLDMMVIPFKLIQVILL